MLVKWALYGMKSSGQDFRNHLHDCMDHLGYFPCKADADLWIRKAKSDEGTDYYKYMLLYVDNTLCASQHLDQALRELGKYF